jgi:predicted oxidoreductase
MWDQMLAENRDNKIKHYDYSKSHIIWSVEQSLKNLKTDYLDVFLLHRPSPLMQSDEIAEAVEETKIRKMTFLDSLISLVLKPN